MEYLFEYLVFFAKAATIVLAVVLIISAVAQIGMRRPWQDRGHLEVRVVNDQLQDLRRTIEQVFVPSGDFKKRAKAEDKQHKKDMKAQAHDQDGKRRLFVLDFEGDLQATHVDALSHEVTAVLTQARPNDEVLVRIDSAGGMVHAYGLAASQLQRIRAKGVKLTAAVDKVAASGGYLMASVAESILAAPFALVGSIGVIAQVPNVHRLLKKHDVDVELHTAGEYKRTLTMFGENTDAGRKKFQEELEDVHQLFQEFVRDNRPSLDLATVATGESWYGRRAVDLNLVDELCTSDEYMVRACDDANVVEVKWVAHMKPLDRLVSELTSIIDRRWFGGI